MSLSDALFPLNTLTLTLSSLSTIGKTFVKHYTSRKKISSETKARESLLYDEAFNVMKKFFEKASMHTVEETQAFGNNFVPAPFWVRVIRVTVPLSTRLEAGKYLIAGLGEEDIEHVVGGREWWQRTSHPESGVCGEWISLKRDWEGLEAEAKARKASGRGKGKAKEEDAERLEERLRQLKEEGRADARRRREEGKARSRATSFSSLSGSDEDAEGASQRRAASAQRRTHGGENYLERTSTHHHEEDAWTPDLDDMPVTLAIHGGAHFFGSTNTHRYWYWRLARKTGGRVFSIDYRLSPQFPFPCALHDCLAAYLYLIQPPPEAKHRPVDPARLTICGDSAGGNLALSLLCLLRDTGLPMPAGAMLISPWGDLTHSFPSVLQNTKTDIPPPYGFSIFKPSTLWPPPPPEFRKRAAQSTSLSGLKRAAHDFRHGSSSSDTGANPTVGSAERHGHRFGTLATHNKAHQLADAVEKLPDHDPQRAEQTGTDGQGTGEKTSTDGEQNKAEVAHVIKVKVDGEEVELVDQIQLYATNEQLVYPFVSPIWQPSLGGLPPLYVMGGDKEVLRDEIIFMAHRAAHPDRYPVREGILKQNKERAEKAKSYPPTKVHLQIYDEVCHDLPLFSFTTPAKYCYRAMASFTKWVTTPEGEQPQEVSSAGMRLPVERDPGHPDGASLRPPEQNGMRSASTSTPTSVRSAAASVSGKTRKEKKARPAPPPIPNLEKTIYSSTQPFNRPDYVDNMIRERVSITGVVRPMELESEMSMLHLDPEDVGLIKEDAVRRYLAGKAILQRKFRKTYEKVQKTREGHLKKSMQEEATRITKRVEELKKQQAKDRKNGSGSSSRLDPSTIDPNAPEQVTDSPEPLDFAQGGRDVPLGVEGVWDLHGEHPPPSSLAGRKDTAEARKLAKVLDEHYSRIHGLALWSGLHDIVRPPRQGSGQTDSVYANGNGDAQAAEAAEVQEDDDDAPSPSVQLGTSSRLP
ncbi:hypothetical protein JCM10450v2_000643 [Rhodotorula kratochvilovae]